MVASRDRGRVLLGLAAVRAVVAVVAIPLAPVLFEEHFAVLVLLRPTKEVLLAGGFLMRRGDLAPLVLAVAAVPLLVAGVWQFYALGRIYGDDLRGDGVPGWARRVLPPKRVEAMCGVLKKRGAPVVVLGRLAAFPSTLVAAAAGASKMPVRTFLVADTIGVVLSFVIVVGAGFALGEAYERAGTWLTVLGVAVLVAVVVLIGRWLRRT